ncbi:MAG: serpin family protein [Bacillota bacterium]|nr:serpin family protein [Bacillota bacterium]
MRSKKTICILLSSLMILLLCSCSKQDPNRVSNSDNLMYGVIKTSDGKTYNFSSGKTSEPTDYSKYITNASNFSVSLFQKSSNTTKNSIISPMAAYFSMCLASIGSDTTTKKQFQDTLNPTISNDNLNAGNNYLIQRIKSFNNDNYFADIANSFWLNNLDTEHSFLLKNANFYNAGIFSLDFKNSVSAKKINNWISDNTNGGITDVVNKTDKDNRMLITDSIFVNTNWTNNYTSDEISKGTFHGTSGNTNANFMKSAERYIHDDKCVGFIKNMGAIPCRFVALMPNEGESLSNFTSQLTGKEFLNLTNYSKVPEFKDVRLPAFSIENSSSISDPLKKTGLTEAFSNNADFSIMSGHKIYISDVLQKTKIEVGSSGVKSDAIADTVLTTTTANNDKNAITFDRPFVFAIIDNESNLPLLMGTVTVPNVS